MQTDVRRTAAEGGHWQGALVVTPDRIRGRAHRNLDSRTTMEVLRLMQKIVGSREADADK